MSVHNTIVRLPASLKAKINEYKGEQTFTAWFIEACFEKLMRDVKKKEKKIFRYR